jgi:hypothetical protein
MRRFLKQLAARMRVRVRQVLDVPDTPHVVEHFTEHGEVIDGLRRDLDAVVNQLNETGRGLVQLARRLRYYETHSAIINRLAVQFDKDEKKRTAAAQVRENGSAPAEVSG